MAKKKEVKSVSYELNMRVTTMSKLDKKLAYWCVPGLQLNGLGKGKFTTYLWADGMGFKMPDEITFNLDYPFDQAYTEKVSLVPADKEFRADSIGDLVYLGAQAYLRAFEWAKKKNIGYWHGIGDLVFEGMSIYEDGTVEFTVGS